MKQQLKSLKVQDTTSGLPSNTNQEIPTTGDNRPFFFYMPNASYGELCQWYSSTFAVSKSQISSLVGCSIDDLSTNANAESSSITFSCAEQFMMYYKASRFRDHETQRRVLATDLPKEQKRLGKLVAGFYGPRWDEVKSEVVVAGNIAKFDQNSKLKRKLLSTGDRELVEAASRDCVWGIGYSEKHALSHRKHWGENRLGRALMEAIEQLRREEAAAEDD